MPNQKPERILRLATEGGGVDFFRHQASDGAWRFTIEALGGGFDRSDFDEDWTPSPPTPPKFFMTIEDAIWCESSDGYWVCWQVLEIHPDFKQHVWQLRERIIESSEDQQAIHARERDYAWAEACGRKFPQSLPKKTTKLENPNAEW